MEDDATSAFPQSHRGWGYAGYNGDGERAEEPIDEGAFVVVVQPRALPARAGGERHEAHHGGQGEDPDTTHAHLL